MSFDIFGPASKDAIRVGYISTDRGFVDGVSVCEANDYAKLNPGTRFIFRTRNFTKYLNINDVNKLTPDDLISTGSTCEGISFESECGPPQVYFYGGGGVGVQGNPVIGEDGSLLAIDLVEGGYGYQYPPIVEVKDRCNIGVGAVTRAVLGEIVETVEVFDQEDDFEEYEICEPTDVGFGQRYGPDGKPIGPWEPSLYANLSKDPIALEIKEYQDFLRELQNPWWSTRKEAPLSMTSGSKVTRTKFNVDYPAWNEFMNSFAISPVPRSNVPGSDFAGIPFTFEWEEDFPYDGEYIFRGLCDNKAELYLDNVKLDDLKSFKDSPNKIQKTIKAGIHRIRLDLLNVPIKQKVLTQDIKPGKINVDFDVYGEGKNTEKISFIFSAEDGSDSFTIKGVSTGKKTRRDTISLKPNINYKVVATSSKTGGVEQGLIQQGKKNKEGGTGTSNKIFVDHLQSDNDNDDGQITARSGIFTSSNKRKSNTTGRNTYDLTFKVEYQSTQTTSSNSSPTSPIKTRNIFNTIDYINKADRKLWRTFPSVGRDGDFIHQYGVTPFDPNTSEANTNSFAGTHVIRWESIDFPVDGNYNIEVMVDDNVTLYIGNRSGGGKVNIGNGLNSVDEGGDEVIITKRGFSGPGKSTGKTTETKFFKAGKYRIRAELEQIKGKPLSQGNPMALAVNIQAAITETEVISAKSWNENPMGVALTIDAPMPPIPQEPIPQQEGRCPNNPIWTTRFPSGKEKWWPVKFDSRSWSKFMNRYAISPIPPLGRNGTDGSGIVYRNSWDLDIPYDGFYGLKGTVDNFGRILIDGKEILGVGRRGITQSDRLDSFKTENPSTKKFFLTKGKHIIEVEVENQRIETYELIDKKIFDTADWISIAKVQTTAGNAATTTEEWVRVDDVFVPPTFQTRDRGQVIKTIPKDASFHQANEGTYYKGKKIRESGDWNNTDPYKNYIEWDSNTRLTLGTYRGFRFAIAVWNRKVTTGNQATTTTTTTYSYANQSPATIGVTYSGPPLASYRTGTLGPFLTPAFKDDADYRVNNMDKKWILKWANVDFPEDGRYDLQAEADDYVIVRVDGNEVGKAKVFDGVKSFTFNATKGKRTIEMEVYNIPGNQRSTFATNPVVFNVKITKKVSQATNITKPWTTNPIGISAILIPPPCPKKIKGKGVVTEVIIDDPGNGFPRPGTGGYPVLLRLKSVEVEDPGINYNCGVDQIQITPSNGAVLDYVCDTFGRIINVNVLSGGNGFTTYPDIRIATETGINARFRPQFEVIRDPIVIEQQKLIQVTDLVGLKQTGYVDGRPYYGSVFYKDGIRYAGFYETPGDLVQVYDTLQESINAQVTTRPSAIQRQGTDVTSNDPRLNIPGTPENLI